MNSSSITLFACSGYAVRLLAVECLLALGPSALAQPAIVLTTPANFATGVSLTAPVIFNFSAAMNTSLTEAEFINSMTFAPITAFSAVWSADKKTLTNTPTTPLPASTMIIWTVTGEDLSGTPLDSSTAGGFFTTGTGTGGGGGTGSGTNEITTFSVAKINYYEQTSTAAPTIDPTFSYGFSASTTLASNRTATGVSVTLPTSTMINLSEIPTQPEVFSSFDFSTNQATFDATYPIGNYLFNVQAASSNQQVTVNYPALVVPNSPHATNYTAAQSVDPAQPFTLGWDAFTGGTATDYISVQVGDVFKTGNPGATNALPGTARSVVIPANTLQANTSYDAYINFFKVVGTTNAGYATVVGRASTTHFNLSTFSGATSSLVLTNGVRAANGVFSFQVTSSIGQSMTIQYSTTLLPNSWNTLLVTNSPGGRILVTDPASAGDTYRFYRAFKGP